MRHPIFFSWALALLVIGGSQSLFAQKDAAKDVTETVTAKTAPFIVVETIDARVESKNTSVVKLDAKTWAAFKVDSVAEQGKQVNEGDTIVSFQSEDIMAKLQELKYEFDLAKIGLDEAKADLDFLVKTQPIDQDLAERAWQQTQDDTRYYFETQKPLAEKQAHRSLENSQYQLEYAQEEMDQLQKMYDSDDLTEESEKIVLKRAERSLDQSQFYLETSELSTKRQLEVEIPRSAKEKETALERGKLEHQKKAMEFPRALERKQLEYAKLAFAFEKKEREYQELMHDVELMNLKAPSSGFVYHGQARRGVWSKGGTTTSRVIESGDAVAAGSNVITIVDMKQLQLRCDIDQKLKLSLQPGSSCIAIFDSQPDKKIDASVVEVGQFPLDDGKFDCQIKLAEMPANIVPGMTCKVKLVSYKNEKATMIPKTSVFSDDGGLTQYVYVLEGEKPVRRIVVALRENGDQLEVTDGLKGGDKVLKSKPE